MKFRKKWSKWVGVAFVAVVVGLFLNSSRGSAHRVAPRTSPDFAHRPQSNRLVDAAGKGDVAAMITLLNSGVNPNANTTHPEGISALSAAASEGHLDAVKLLLARGADVNADDFWGGNALVGASVAGNVEVVDELLAHGADPNMEDDGTTALDYASHQLVNHETAAPLENYRKIVATLNEHGAQTALINRPLAVAVDLMLRKIGFR